MKNTNEKKKENRAAKYAIETLQLDINAMNNKRAMLLGQVDDINIGLRTVEFRVRHIQELSKNE
jgi:hypothetical protein